MSFGKWLVTFSLALVIFLVATSVVASPIEKEKSISTNLITLTVVPAPGTLAANLVWSHARGNVLEYLIARSTDEGTTWPTAFSVPATLISYQDTSVARSGTYWYRIFAHVNDTYALVSSTIKIYIGDTVPTQPVYLAAATNSLHSITLTWNNTTTAVDGFIVERAAGQGPDLAFKVVARLNSPLATDWTDSTLPGGSTYTYQVRAFNQFGTSYPSAPVKVNTPQNH